MQEPTANDRLNFWGGAPGAMLPILTFVAGATYLGLAGAPDERGLWTVLLAALGLALVLCRNRERCAEVMIEGMASGNSTFHKSCQREQPKASAASLVVSGTPRMPSAVSRITGGMAKIRVASTPGGLPVPKKAMMGIR